MSSKSKSSNDALAEAIHESRTRRKEFVAMIREQERLAAADPVAYRKRVRNLAYLGYAYIFGVLIATFVVLFGLIWVMIAFRTANVIIAKLLIVVVPIAWIVVRSLFVKLSDPPGIKLTRNEAPELYAEIDRISDQLGAPRVDGVILDQDVNAAAAQIPKFGFFGPTRNMLVLGMPLLLTLSPDEARSVIAHEFGHFSGQHGRFEGWIYRLNTTWAMLQAHLAQQGSWMFGRFFRWFEPRFDATTFALRRQNEYEADAAACKVAGAPAASRALMRFSYVVPHLQKHFWDPLYDRVKTEATPPQNALAEMQRVAKQAISPEFVEKRLIADLNFPTGYADTHPSTSDRIRAMGQHPGEDPTSIVEELAAGVTVSAAETFFGSRLGEVLARVNEEIVGNLKEGWAKAHQSVVEQKKELADLRERAEKLPLNESEQCRLAILVRSVESDEEALPLLRKVVEKFPDNATARYALGESLLDLELEEGVGHIEHAIRVRSEWTMDGLQRIARFRSEQGEADEVESLRDQAHEIAIQERLAERELWNMTLKDVLVPHRVDEADVSRLAEKLRQRTDVKDGFLVHKNLTSIPGRSQAVLILIPKTGIVTKGNESTELIEKISKEVEIEFPVFLYSPEPETRKAWVKKLDKIANARIV